MDKYALGGCSTAGPIQAPETELVSLARQNAEMYLSIVVEANALRDRALSHLYSVQQDLVDAYNKVLSPFQNRRNDVADAQAEYRSNQQAKIRG